MAAKKKLINKTKNWENVPTFEAIGVLSVESSLVDNQYWKRSEILHTFMPNIS